MQNEFIQLSGFCVPNVYFYSTHFHCSCHYLVANSEIFRWELIVFKIEGHNVGENVNHGVIAEGINAKNVEMPQEAWSHSIPSTARGAHSWDDLEINKSDLGGILQVIPARVDEVCLFEEQCSNLVNSVLFIYLYFSRLNMNLSCNSRWFIPVSVVYILSKKLYRRLCSKLFQCRHVHVIYKDDTLFSHGGSKHALPSLI